MLRAASSGSSDLLGGADLLQLLVLAVGGALVVGNGLALVRPPKESSPAGASGQHEGQQVNAPVGRSVTMIVIGLIAVIWAIASLTN